MNTNQGLRWKMGLFVLGSLLMLAVLVLLFGGLPTLLSSRNRYEIRFMDAPGVTVGTPIRRSGVRVGEVSAVNLDSESGDVLVSALLDVKFIPRANEEPTIIQGLLTGDTTIDFLPRPVAKEPTPDRSPLPPGSVLIGKTPLDARALLNAASDVLPSAQQSLDQIRRSMQRLEKLSPDIETTVREFGELARSARELIPEFRKTNDQLRDILSKSPVPPMGGIGVARQPILPGDEELEEIVDAIQGRPVVQAPPMPDRKTNGNLRRTLEEMESAARTLTRVGERMEVLIAGNEKKINDTLDNLNDLTKRANRVLSDDNQANLTETLKNIRGISEDLRPASKQADETLKQAQKTIQKLNDTLHQAETILTDLRPTTAELRERGPGLIRNVDAAAKRLSTGLEALDDVRELIRAIGRNDGTIQKLLSDPELYNTIHQTVLMINKLMPHAEQILRDFEVFSDKLARHPELLGARGALRGSDGLKEPSMVPSPTRPRLLPHGR